MTTIAKLAELIGTEHTIDHYGLTVRVSVLDARQSFGRTDVLVVNRDPVIYDNQPLESLGNRPGGASLWIDASRLQGGEE